ncbi:MAG: MFS transporter, partial [Candidatus Lokiarchaeota archaeon]|nr:MFS transporter [Candidatus Lokiarchaeota archaeon]
IIDIIIADIVDEDEIETGMRREGGYYGVNIFFQRFATVFVFLIMGSVFLIADWGVFDPITLPALEIRSLMSIYPAIALIIAIIAIYFYPLDGDKLKKVKEQRDKIHQEKKSNI